MSILLTILVVLIGLVALVLFAALFMKKEHYTRREITIDAPRQKVFDYVRLLRNQDEFNKNAKAGGERERSFRGTDGTVGYIYSWKGDKDAGEGEKEIRDIVDGKRVETEIRFVKPMRVSATMIMELEALSDLQTKVYWSNAGTLRYPLNIMIPLLQRHVARDMDASLSELKSILQK